MFVYNDGGRAVAGYKGTTGDCAVRAIAIATGKPYQEVYDALQRHSDQYAQNHRCKVAKKIRASGSSPRLGVFGDVFRDYLLSLGWKWMPTMGVGTGCKVHLNTSELLSITPYRRLICRVSKHFVAVIDGVINDTYDCSREGTRCVYGFYYK